VLDHFFFLLAFLLARGFLLALAADFPATQ
jgi:hypothetical protein